jgi:hypothetical protein
MVGAVHLLAAIERRLGQMVQARRHFEQALRLAPADAQIHNDYANLLDDLGDGQAAIQHYARALELRPGFADARFNLGYTARRAGQRGLAIRMLEAALEVEPSRVAGWMVLAELRLEAGQGLAAEQAVAHVLAMAQGHPKALHLHARIQAALGRDARSAYQAAHAAAPDDPMVAVGYMVALHDAGDHTGLAQLARLVDQNPDCAAAHGALAQLRWQTGDRAGLTRSYRAALDCNLHSPTLWNGYLGLMARAGLYDDVLNGVDDARCAIGEHVFLDQHEAVAASEGGQIVRADAAFARLPDEAASAALLVGRMRHLLRCRRFEDAVALGETWADHVDMAAVRPYLSLAWRCAGDSRATWLEREGTLAAAFDLGFDADALVALAATLRRLHVMTDAPFDQTIRGGTQTDGDVLAREDPVLRDARKRIEDAIARYVAGLPPPEKEHPFLGHERNECGFAGSWSVRLTEGGYHVPHTHPHGWIGSALHVAVPPSGGTLVFGEAPPELGLDLPSLREVVPRPGWLVMFPANSWHGTRPFPRGERLSIAFDVI